MTWRLQPQRYTYYAYLLAPTKVFEALVNGSTWEYPLAEVTFDGVLTGAYTDLSPNLMVTFGTTRGGSDLGIQRVRPGSTASTLKIGWSSRGTHDGEVDLQNDTYITVWNLRVVTPKMPRITDDGTIYKDYDLDFATYGLEPPPVANAGPGYGEFIDPDTDIVTVPFADQGSFTTTDGATIATHAWDFVDGTPSSSSSASPGDVTFPAGFRYIAHTVTDSEGHSHTAYAPVVGAEKTGANRPIKCIITRHNQRIEGTEIKIKLLENAPRSTYIDHTLIMIWAREVYGATFRQTGALHSNTSVTGLAGTKRIVAGMSVSGTGIPANTTVAAVVSASQITLSQAAAITGASTLVFGAMVGSLAGVSGREHMVFVGWVQNEDHTIDSLQHGVMKGSILTCVDVARRLAALPGFPQEIRRKTMATTWTEMQIDKAPAHIGRYIHYLLHWHSTALELADFTWAGTDYPFSWLQSDGASLYEQADGRCQAIAGRLGCNRQGQLKMVFDPQLQLLADRTSTIVTDIDETDWIGVHYTYAASPRTHWSREGAVLISTGDADSEVPIAYFAIAPGRAPGWGLNAEDKNYQLVKTEQELYDRAGRRYAALLNNRYGSMDIELVHGGEIGIDPAEMTWVRLTVSAANGDRRGGTFTDDRLLPVEVNYTYNAQTGVRKATVACEREVLGDIAAVSDPQPTAQADTIGDWSGGDWASDQIDTSINLNLPDFSITDWNAEVAYDPAVSAPDPKGTGAHYGRMFALVNDPSDTDNWRVVSITWPAGTVSYADISPTSAQRTIVGIPIRMVIDPFNYKHVIIKGTTGIVYTNNITVAVPVWALVQTISDYDFTKSAYATKWQTPSTTEYTASVYTAGGGYSTSDFRDTSPQQFYRRMVDLKLPFSPSVRLYSVWIQHNYTKSSLNEHDPGALYSYLMGAGGVTFKHKSADDVSGSDKIYNPTCNILASFLNVFIQPSIHYTAQYSGAALIKRIKVYTGPGEVGVPAYDFQPACNRKNTYFWISTLDIGGTDYIYFNWTLDNFTHIGSSIVGKWDGTLTHGFTVNPHNWRQIAVVAGLVSDGTAALYTSEDGGQIWTKSVALLNARGGAPWWNWSTQSPNTRNNSWANLLWIKGLDGSNNFQVVKGLSGTPVTIVTNATRYPESPFALGANARDLDYVNYVARTGHFYKSSDATATWAYTATAPTVAGTIYRGWWQWPKDSAFEVLFGTKSICYTKDTGATFTDLWSSYSTWASGQYGSAIGTGIINIVIDLSQDFVVPVI